MTAHSLGLPELAEGLGGEEAGDEDQHQRLAEQPDPRLVQLRLVHGARVHRAVVVSQVCLDALLTRMQVKLSPSYVISAKPYTKHKPLS